MKKNNWWEKFRLGVKRACPTNLNQERFCWNCGASLATESIIYCACYKCRRKFRGVK